MLRTTAEADTIAQRASRFGIKVEGDFDTDVVTFMKDGRVWKFQGLAKARDALSLLEVLVPIPEAH